MYLGNKFCVFNLKKKIINVAQYLFMVHKFYIGNTFVDYQRKVGVSGEGTICYEMYFRGEFAS